ncbi:MAG: transposase [Bryobacteraceae bacterium]
MALTRRHLPHWIPGETPVFVTWRVAGSLPAQPEIAEWDGGTDHRFPWSVTPPLKRSRATDDKKRSSVPPSGPVWLQDPRVASIVANALLYGEAERRLYQLHAWVVMPNHVHAILRPHAAMPTIMRWLKGRTSRVANRILGRAGTAFWQDESFDHWIRSAQELQYFIEYVEANPLKAGLVEAKEQWPWSSACQATDHRLLWSVSPPQPPDRRQETIVCPTCHVTAPPRSPTAPAASPLP